MNRQKRGLARQTLSGSGNCASGRLCCARRTASRCPTLPARQASCPAPDKLPPTRRSSQGSRAGCGPLTHRAQVLQYKGRGAVKPTLDWIGKQAVVNHHREVPYRLIHCDGALSAGDTQARNLLVQGDNLAALRALLTAASPG